MRKLPAPARPSYLIGSVDNALSLLQILRDHGRVRLTEAAAELDVSESTAHRLLAMLVFRGFAVQDDSRAYLPGPALGAAPSRLLGSRELIQAAAPHLTEMVRQTGETVNLIIRVHTLVHFLWSQEGENKSRIISRKGIVLPARTTASGRMLLSDLPESELRLLYQGTEAELEGEAMREDELQDFLRRLHQDRHSGYARATAETERGVSALALPLRDIRERTIASIAVAVPVARSHDLLAQEVLELGRSAQAKIEAGIHRRGISADAVVL